ncbi:beta-glucosidase 30-like isoform X2 [Vicia villosa]|uniref:beta-glucosidase 30-like isoform X2 n=1 Tax=Vicia villosa TaxID=3911 RepID=UPI00273CD0A0|nr:beta-glucosidase 30-like isoform X2 [Vicia villosa]
MSQHNITCTCFFLIFYSYRKIEKLERNNDKEGERTRIYKAASASHRVAPLSAGNVPTSSIHYEPQRPDLPPPSNCFHPLCKTVDGTLKGGINQEGIEPFVGIMHFDYPLALKQKHGGFLNRSIVKYYKDYSELLFKTHGDRVKHWTTINEAEFTAIVQYMFNIDNISSDQTCINTKICTKTYTLVHNFLRVHAITSKLYTTKFQAIQRGEIGLVISSGRYVPYSSNPEDVVVAQRLMDFYWGWILDLVFHGDYPRIMKELVGIRLPKFTKKEKHMLKGSTNFIGINYYTSHFVRHESNRTKIMADNYDALAVSEDSNAEGKILGFKDQYGWSNVYSEGLYNFLIYIKEKYKNPKVYITENGIASSKISNPLKDEHRIAYVAAHLNVTKTAINSLCKNAKYNTCTFYGCAFLLQVWGWWRVPTLAPASNDLYMFPYATEFYVKGMDYSKNLRRNIVLY